MKLHVSLDVAGAIRGFKPGYWRRSMKDSEGRYLTPTEVKDWLLEQLAHGKRRVPFGDPCEGFSHETGCPGHESDESDDDEGRA